MRAFNGFGSILIHLILFIYISLYIYFISTFKHLFASGAGGEAKEALARLVSRKRQELQNIRLKAKAKQLADLRQKLQDLEGSINCKQYLYMCI